MEANNKLNYYRSFCKVLICLMAMAMFNGVALPDPNTPDGGAINTAAYWTQVPLRSQGQYETGLTGGEGMQLITGITYAASNQKVVYLVSDTSQVWKSEDGGNSWQRKHKGFLSNGGLSIIVHPTNENIAFVAGSVMEPDVSDEDADGIYRTLDGGESWQLVRQTPFTNLDSEKGGVHFAFGSGNIVYAGASVEGVLKSQNMGNSWQPLHVFENEKILDIKVHPLYDFILFVAVGGSLYQVTDNGDGTAGYQELGGGTLPDFPRAVAVNPQDPDIIYVTLGKSGVYQSTDGGGSFNPCNDGLSAELQGDGEGVNYISMSTVNPDYLYVSFYLTGTFHPYYTRNGCLSQWKAPSVIDKYKLIDDIHKDSTGEFLGTPIAPHPTNINVAIASMSGNHIEKTDDGGDTWTYSGNGYTGGAIGDIAWDLSNPDRFVFFLTDYGVYITNDGGSNFKQLIVPEYKGSKTTTAGAIAPDEPDLIVTSVGTWDEQVIAVTRNGGQTWSLFDGHDSQHPLTEGSYSYIGFHSEDANVIYAGSYKSTDRGYTWEKMEKNIIAVHPGNGDTVYAMEIRDGEFETIVFRSMEAGTNGSWRQPYGAIPSQDVKEIAVAVGPSGSSERIYATSLYYGVFIWDGTNWLEKYDLHGLEPDRFDSNSTLAIAVDPNSAGTVYAGKWIGFKGHANGVFASYDYGESWENITHELGPEFSPWSLFVNPNNSEVYIGSPHGSWRAKPRSGS